jgi:ABC-type glycerol-3-phosphate transport system substrate-binding protein
MMLTRRATLVLALAAALAAASAGAFAQGRGARDETLSPAAREQLRRQVESARRDAR